MTDGARPLDDEPDVAAAELALGLLEGEERAAALRRQLADPDFAREVEHWRRHLAMLFASIPEVAPSAGLEQRVLGRIAPAAPARRRDLWKPLAIASSIAASVFGVLLLRPEAEPPPPVIAPAPAPAPMMVAAFTIEGFDKPVVGTYDSGRRTLKMPGPMPIPAGRDAQLWAIVDDKPPQPLGLFHEAGSDVVADTPAAAPFAAGTTFAISLEPTGGSPTGRPTGPVVASGTLTRV